MKRIVLYLIVLLCCPHVWAQHMDFCGVELTGTIRNVSDKMRKAGFKLKEKRTDDCFYIFEGKYCGQTTFFNVNYTPKTNTVYQVRVTPRHINEEAFLDSLIAKYGSEYESTGEGYCWSKENGGIFYIKKDHYDPFVVIIDAEGMELRKKEGR